MSAKPYTAIVSLINWKVDRQLENNLQCKMVSNGTSRTSAFPFQDVYCLDISENSKDIQIYFIHDGKEIASGSLTVPSKLNESMEIETSAKLKTSLYGISVENQELEAEFNLTFINSNLYQNNQKKSTTNSNVSKKSKKKTTSISEVSPVHARVSTSRNTSKERGHSYNETELNSYLNKVVDRHFEESKNRVGQDLSDVSDCIHLNKFNKIANSELVNASAISPSKSRSRIGGDTYTELDHTASPEKLRTRYNKGASKSPNKAGPDMTSILMDTETRRYVNEYKNQLEYLRTIVYSLDLKLREQDTFKREVSNLRAENDKGNNAREELRKTLLETTQDLKEESAKFNQLVLDLESHNKDILRDLKAANNKVDDVETKCHSLEIRNAQLENENAELRAKVKSGEVYKKQLEQARNDYINAEKKHNDTLVSLGDRIKTLDDNLNKLGHQKKGLLQENGRLNNTISELKVQLNQEKTNNADLQHELDVSEQPAQADPRQCRASEGHPRPERLDPEGPGQDEGPERPARKPARADGKRHYGAIKRH
jgi:predicted  nucleic acid-binding Zn-ribbon protein